MAKVRAIEWLRFSLLLFYFIAVFADLMAGKDANTTVLAVSNIISFKNLNEPLQGHLSLTAQPMQMMSVFVCAQLVTILLLSVEYPGSHSTLLTLKCDSECPQQTL